ncbi:phosphate-starvation-inducible PsiE family protein [Thermocrinis minervae]|uniref:Uncharacterized membrane protein, DUF373 family n=1 Tax=Thermocrinis minervae TaxID=381751 RepID=A0A1M6T6C4_9AQUI|nr:phosphate-starvation-inducible PsiE family protein [Thermocrinis minervae]SHK52308.1 Uncharacterized membrane protein, DUF373 family [Thermocrinis minervae]
MQELVLKVYRIFIRIAFNVTLVILIVALFIGLARTTLELGLTVTEETVRLGFKELVTNVLSLVVVLELIRAFIDFFEYDRIRVDILMDVLLAFLTREFMLKLFEGKMSGLDVFLWSLGIGGVVLARMLSQIHKLK